MSNYYTMYYACSAAEPPLLCSTQRRVSLVGRHMRGRSRHSPSCKAKASDAGLEQGISASCNLHDPEAPQQGAASCYCRLDTFLQVVQAICMQARYCFHQQICAKHVHNASTCACSLPFAVFLCWSGYCLSCTHACLSTKTSVQP